MNAIHTVVLRKLGLLKRIHTALQLAKDSCLRSRAIIATGSRMGSSGHAIQNLPTGPVSIALGPLLKELTYKRAHNFTPSMQSG